jgi:dipeptidyl aminopeptidase/acylaminoacyl peptidase
VGCSNAYLQGVFRGEVGKPAVTGELSHKPQANAELLLARRKLSQLFIVDVVTRAITQLTKDEKIYFNPQWSPDGKRIACASSDGRPLSNGGVAASNIHLIDIASSKDSALTTGSGGKRLPVWSPDGASIAYMGGEFFGPESVYLVPARSGAPVNLTTSLNRSVTEFSWTMDSRSIIFSYIDGVSYPIARADARTGAVTNVSGDDAAYRSQVTVGLDTVAWQQSNASSLGVIWVGKKGRPPYVLIDLNPQIRDWLLGPSEVVRWKNSRAEELEGVLIKPVGYDPRGKYPLIVDGYPQTQMGFWSHTHGLAARGYLVFFASPRSPVVWINPFKTQAFDQAVRGSKGWDIIYDDVMSGVDTLIQRGIADGDRLGLYGFSNGGAVVNALLTKTGRFKCAVSVAGALGVDWFLPFFLATSDPFIPTAAGATPWQDPSLYIELSPIYHLDKVTTPILLADGDLDGSILLTDIEMYNALRWLGKEVTFLRYPDQGHGFTGDALKDFWERENAFFDKYLKPEQAN